MKPRIVIFFFATTASLSLHSCKERFENEKKSKVKESANFNGQSWREVSKKQNGFAVRVSKQLVYTRTQRRPEEKANKRFATLDFQAILTKLKDVKIWKQLPAGSQMGPGIYVAGDPFQSNNFGQFLSILELSGEAPMYGSNGNDRENSVLPNDSTVPELINSDAPFILYQWQSGMATSIAGVVRNSSSIKLVKQIDTGTPGDLDVTKLPEIDDSLDPVTMIELLAPFSEFVLEMSRTIQSDVSDFQGTSLGILASNYLVGQKFWSDKANQILKEQGKDGICVSDAENCLGNLGVFIRAVSGANMMGWRPRPLPSSLDETMEFASRLGLLEKKPQLPEVDVTADIETKEKIKGILGKAILDTLQRDIKFTKIKSYFFKNREKILAYFREKAPENIPLDSIELENWAEMAKSKSNNKLWPLGFTHVENEKGEIIDALAKVNFMSDRDQHLVQIVSVQKDKSRIEIEYLKSGKKLKGFTHPLGLGFAEAGN